MKNKAERWTFEGKTYERADDITGRCFVNLSSGLCPGLLCGKKYHDGHFWKLVDPRILALEEAMTKIAKIEQSECYEDPYSVGGRGALISLQRSLRECGNIARKEDDGEYESEEAADRLREQGQESVRGEGMSIFSISAIYHVRVIK